jgi:phenylpropionate dioxygenase-like ring-hydroxylating dioxygenase large terminal subunit
MLLRKYPIIIGHSSKLKVAGDFFTDDSTGVPIIVVRQADGSVRALLNVCRHRAATVCTELHGNRRNFICPYHAWSYKLDGSLLRIPHDDGFPNLDKKQAGLVELPVEERHGFIWVVATAGATIDVAAHLGALDAELASYDMTALTMERETVLTEDMNWKFAIDGFLETYHFPALHSKSISPYFHSRCSAYDEYGLNGRLVGVRKSFTPGTLNEDTATAEITKHFAFNYLIFPNTVLVWQGDHFESWTSFPGSSPDQCRVHVQSITTVAATAEEFKSKWDKNWKILIGTVVAEDWAVSKTIQKSLHAVPNDQIVFGRNEPGLQHYHGHLRKEITAG